MARRESSGTSRKAKAKGPPKGKPRGKKSAPASEETQAEQERGSNFRPPSTKDESDFTRYAKLYESQMKTVKKAEGIVQSEKQALGTIAREMKENGIAPERIRIMKKTLKERMRDPAEVLVEERERAWQHTALKSKIVEVLPFSSLLAPPALPEIELSGEHAGRNAEPRDNNPWTPGTAQFTAWAAGHKKGQREAANTVFDGPGTAVLQEDGMGRKPTEIN